MWGPHTIDRFANSANTKVRRFISRYCNPSSESVDAFTQHWGFDNNWLVPPIYSVLWTIKHLFFCKARGTLIVPGWTSAPYWPLFLINIWFIEIRYWSDKIQNTNGIYKKGTNDRSIFGAEPFYSPGFGCQVQRLTVIEYGFIVTWSMKNNLIGHLCYWDATWHLCETTGIGIVQLGLVSQINMIR